MTSEQLAEEARILGLTKEQAAAELEQGKVETPATDRIYAGESVLTEKVRNLLGY